jgi:UDP-2-acetamido-2,6-beta-L-arabino-hexul-4-ose reductase
MEFNRESSLSELDEYCKSADFVIHLAGVNRPQHPSEFTEGNVDLTSQLIENLKKHNNRCPILFTSSTQATQSNPYGTSKQMAEQIIQRYSFEYAIQYYIYRLPNVFGKWCKPHYNSVVATWCHQIANQQTIKVNDPNVELNLVYIDDVIEEFNNAINGTANHHHELCEVSIKHTIQLGQLAEVIQSFRNSREHYFISNMADPLTKKLYSTYLSYLPTNEFSYPLKMNVDHRGSFTEFVKTPDRGQVSINVSKPGITKGNHWHHTKNEKFLVVSGRGVIRFRKIDTDEVIEYYVSGERMEVVDIPPGYTHHIENLGDNDMVTIMWANELYDKNKPDTYYVEV